MGACPQVPTQGLRGIYPQNMCWARASPARSFRPPNLDGPLLSSPRLCISDQAHHGCPPNSNPHSTNNNITMRRTNDNDRLIVSLESRNARRSAIESLDAAFAPAPAERDGARGRGGRESAIDPSLYYEAMDDADRYAAHERALSQGHDADAERHAAEALPPTQPVTPAERSMTRTGGASAARLSTPGNPSDFVASGRPLLSSKSCGQ